MFTQINNFITWFDGVVWGLPFPPVVASFALMICLVFFAFTTILGWDYYGERCLEYLFNKNMKAVRAPVIALDLVWLIADTLNALMAIPNLIALLALSKVIVKETKAFTEKLNVEEKNQRILKGMNAENA